MIERFLEVLVPLFVATSPLTVLPMFLNITEGIEPAQSRRLGRRAVATGLVIAVTIVMVGRPLFQLLNITVDDLRVGGGLVLLLIAVYDLIFSREQRKAAEIEALDPGVVPLGTPLIVGPATMTACLVLTDSHGPGLVVLGLTANLLAIGIILHYAGRLRTVFRPSYTRAFGKVMSLFMVAIAVSMLRTGLANFLRSGNA